MCVCVCTLCIYIYPHYLQISFLWIYLLNKNSLWHQISTHSTVTVICGCAQSSELFQSDTYSMGLREAVSSSCLSFAIASTPFPWSGECSVFDIFVCDVCLRCMPSMWLKGFVVFLGARRLSYASWRTYVLGINFKHVGYNAVAHKGCVSESTIRSKQETHRTQRFCFRLISWWKCVNLRT